MNDKDRMLPREVWKWAERGVALHGSATCRRRLDLRFFPLESFTRD
jgi:hypothetical protein